MLKQAVVSVEDRSFYTNNGLDLSGTRRALIANIRGQEIVQGGSTITQQYVKNAYVGTERTLEREVKEGVLARQLTRVVDKDEILFNYLDGIYLGEGAFGVGAASQSYFRKPVNELSLSEAALLAGLIPAPSRYEPRGNLDAAEARRVLVLDAMREQDYINADEHAEARRLRLWLTAHGPAPQPSTLVYPPTDPSDNEYPYFVDYVRRYLESKYGQAVYAGGLEIRTTLDPRLQELADRTVGEALDGTQPPIEMVLVSLEPRTGFVRARVGGREFSPEDGQVNLALGTCAFPPNEAVTRSTWPPAAGSRTASS
ncbi:MAG: penicillin-binding protein [Actinomycetota bacterium]|nr:penicillin-binding protein [Actinomycetota bacterium]